ncbi:MAG: phosphoenolpyruvate kinase [Deltaproteobacteria bacterium]|nr:phosphoenolpyruvate kinase [Deltaproteobacteria bacterium]
MQTTLPSVELAALSLGLTKANAAVAARYPGDSGGRQPVHTVYGGAHLFRSDTVRKLGDLALRSVAEHAPEPGDLLRAVGLDLPRELARTIQERVLEKLRREPVEDFRIDFEDGYGIRTDDEEDGHAAAAAEETAKGMAAGTLPPFLGIRVKAFTEEMRARALRTLDVYLTALVRATSGKLPGGFVVTLPKVTSPGQVAVLAEGLGLMEKGLGLRPGALRIELMIETTQAIFAPDGRVALPALVDAARGRCGAAHFGTYDYTASCDVTAAHQSMTHPACDFAKHVIQVSLAGTGIWLSDGATTVMPIAPHRATKGGPPLTAAQITENLAAVHRAWRLHASQVRHSLEGGYYQGWDLHPAQLPTRYAAVHAFFLEGLDTSAERLRNFVEKAAQATLIAGVFDDAATGQGLLNTFLRAINCGAITEAEALARTGLGLEELRTRSFAKILEKRRA